MRGNKKSVVVLHYGGDQIRGSEVCLLHTLDALCEAGFQLTLLSNNDTLLESLLDKPIELALDQEYPEIMLDGGAPRLPLLRYFKAYFRLRRKIKALAPAILLSNGGLPCQLAVPVGKSLRIPVLCHFHHPVPKRYFYLWLVNRVDGLFFPSQFTQSVVKRKCHRSGDVIYNAVDLKDRFIPLTTKQSRWKKQYNIDKSAIVVGQVGALCGHKRQDLVLRSFSEVKKIYPTVHLILVGRGEMGAMLADMVAELGLQASVTLTGYVDDVLPFLQHVIDINVLASVEEGLGISVIEASGCGLPSIVSDCTGLSEVVEDGVTGIKFPPDNQESLTQAMLSLVESKDLRTRLGEAARQRAKEKFALDKYKRGILKIVNKYL